MKKTDITERIFGRLTAKYYVFSKDGRAYWHCICSCGNEKDIMAKELLSGKIKSCGCYRKIVTSKRMKTHGYSETRLYYIWESMKRRCETCKDKKHLKDYKERGIKVCNEWHKFTEFQKWSLENGYKDNLSIDRIDNDGNYCPENCRWVSNKVQANNKRNNVFLTYNNRKQTIAQWADEFGMKYNTLDERLRKGWSVERAISTPVRKVQKRVKSSESA